MGGRLKLESTPGQGTRFFFTVRLGRGNGTALLPARPIDLKQLAVLVVDDNATNRTICTDTLSHWKMLPRAVPSGTEALTELHRAADAGTPYALVLLDAAMPEMDGFAVAAAIHACPQLVGTTILMLSSADRVEGIARCRDLGIPCYLVKPIKRSELLEAILCALGSAVKTNACDSPLARPFAHQRGVRSLRILLAEDNRINQQVAMRLLKKWGHTVTICANGRDAVDAVAAGNFDAVLMDMEMPIMDGLTATAEIRAREAGSGTHIPIVALTAHAMDSDRERCLAGGMDGYVSKPLRAKDLADAFADLFDGQPAGQEAAAC
jgi:CheY-like chemotaxis protein